MAWPDGSTLQGAFALGKASVELHPGQLLLDFYDSSTRHLVWRAAALLSANMDGKPEKRQKQMDKATDKLLKGYPPR